MDNIGERIAHIVKESGLTKTAFAEKLNLSQSYVSSLCVGRKIPSDRTISDICKAFDVSEEWLRTGKGNPDAPKTHKDEFSATIDRLLPGESAEFRRRLSAALSVLTDEHWILLEQKLKEIAGQRDTPQADPPPSPPPQVPEPPQDLAKELADLREQNQQLAALVAEQRKEIDQIKREGATSDSVKAAEVAYEKSLGIVPRPDAPAWSISDDMEAGEDLGTA